jgi:hypothetical protein
MNFYKSNPILKLISAVKSLFEPDPKTPPDLDDSLR